MASRDTFRHLLSGILLLVLCSCHKEEGTSGGIIATLSGKPVSVEDLRETARFSGMPGLSALPLDKWPAEVRQILFQETVVDRLLLDYAANHGIEVTPENVSREKDRIAAASSAGSPSQPSSDRFSPPNHLLRRKLLLEKVAESLAPQPEIPARELKAYYLEHKAHFTLQEKAVVRDIVVRSEDEGNSILTALKGGSSFQALAKVKSLSPEARNGGLLPPFAMGEMPAPFYRAFSMKPGEVSPLIPSPYGYHILKLVRIIPPEVLPFSSVRTRIRAKIDRTSVDRALKVWVQKKLGESSLQIHPQYRSIFSLQPSLGSK